MTERAHAVIPVAKVLDAIRNLCQKFPLRGQISPAPGENVTAGDKRGNLASRSETGGSFPRQNRKTVFYASTVFGAVLQKLTKNAGSGRKMAENTSSFLPYML